jgi:hypothetical protein
MVQFDMAESEQEFLLELWGKNICPNCGREIPQGTRVGSGKKSEGGFCSLDCYTEYYNVDLVERARKAASAFVRHQNS